MLAFVFGDLLLYLAALNGMFPRLTLSDNGYGLGRGRHRRRSPRLCSGVCKLSRSVGHRIGQRMSVELAFRPIPFAHPILS